MNDFQEWTEANKVGWTLKPHYEKVLYHPPQTKIVVKEYWMSGFYCYHSEIERDSREEALSLYGLIEGHMSIAMERELVLELQDRISKFEERRNHGQQNPVEEVSD